MNDIQVFNSDEFGKVRTVLQDGEPWFVGKDIADALGYSATDKAIRDHVENEDKLTDRFGGSGQMREMVIINESGLYSLVLSSKLPTAKKFKHWITSAVLPSIRKTGGYIAGQETMTDAELMASALLVAKRQIDEKDRRISEMRPKEIFADAVSVSNTSILVGDLAKLIKQNGIEIGQKRLFDWLREHDFLIKSGSSKNMPTQRAMDQQLFTVKESTIQNPDGSARITKTTKVTGKGQQYFVNRFLSLNEA